MSRQVLKWNEPSVIKGRLGLWALKEYRARKRMIDGVGVKAARKAADKWLKRDLGE